MKNKIFIATLLVLLIFSGCKNSFDFSKTKPSNSGQEITLNLTLKAMAESRAVCVPEINDTGVQFYKISVTQNSITNNYDFAVADDYSLKVKAGDATFEIVGYKTRTGEEGNYTYSNPALYFSGDKTISAENLTLTVHPITKTENSGLLSGQTGTGIVYVKVQLPSGYADKLKSVSYNISNSTAAVKTETIEVKDENITTTGSEFYLEEAITDFTMGKYNCVFAALSKNNVYYYYSVDFEVGINLTTYLTQNLSAEAFDSVPNTNLAEIKLQDSSGKDLITFDAATSEYDCYGISSANNYKLLVSMGTAAQKINVDIKKEGESTTNSYDFSNVTGYETGFIDLSKDYAQVLTIPLNQGGNWLGTDGKASTLKIKVTKGGQTKTYNVNLHPNSNVVYYVNANGSVYGTGTKEDPFKEIQSAIGTISGYNPGDGTLYTLVLQSDFTAESSSFTSHNANDLLNGYVCIISDNDKKLNLKIQSEGSNVYKIDAGGVAVAGAASGNGGRPLYIGSASSAAVNINVELKNVQITGGYIKGTDNLGAGIYVGQYNNLTLSGNTIVGNPVEVTKGTQATESLTTSTSCGNYSDNKCGGIYLLENSTLNMKDQAAVCGNYAAGHGAGIFAEGSGITVNVGSEDNHSPSVYGNNSTTDRYNCRGAGIYGSAAVNLYGSVHHNYSKLCSGGIEVNGGVLKMYEGASIYDNRSEASSDGVYAGAIHIPSTDGQNPDKNATVACYLYGGTIENNCNSGAEAQKQREIQFQEPKDSTTLAIDFSKLKFGDSAKALYLAQDVAITVLNEPEEKIPLLVNSYTNGNVILKGSSGSTTCVLTDAICQKFTAKIGDSSTEYAVKLDSTSNYPHSAVIYVVDLAGASDGSGGLSLSLEDNISITINGNSTSIAAGADSAAFTASVKVNNELILVSGYTLTGVVHNGGVVDSGSTVTVGETNSETQITVSNSGFAPGTYTVYLTLNYNSKTYNTSFDFTVSD